MLNSDIERIEDLTIEKVEYVENESGSFSIVNFLMNDEKGSMLVSLAVNEGVPIHDGQEICLCKEDDPIAKQAWVTSSTGDLWKAVDLGHFSLGKIQMSDQPES